METKKHKHFSPECQAGVRFLAGLRAHIVLAGGTEFSDADFLAMNFGDLLALLYKNDMRLGISRVGKGAYDVFHE